VPFVYDPRSGNLLLDIVVTNQQLVPNWGGNDWDDTRLGWISFAVIPYDGIGRTGAALGGLVTQFNK
jgi:hypothetical protein